MIKLTKEKLKDLIKEELSAPNTYSSGKVFTKTLGQEYIRNYKNGEPPNNQNYEQAYTREPYETGPIETEIEGGEVYTVYGDSEFKLVFNNNDLTSGIVAPVGQYKFTIVNGMIDWFESTPAHVRNNAELERQILDYSGREK